jgi:predicted PurR-regulated permease PerM
MATEIAAPRVRAAWLQMLPTLATFVLMVLVIGCLYWARPVLIPTALAVLLAFLLSPVVTWLQRRGLPRGGAVLVVVVLAGLLLGGIGYLVGSQIVQLAADLPAYQENIAKRIADVREQGGNSIVGNVQRFIQEVTAALSRPTATAAAATEPAVPVAVVEPASAGFTWWLQGLGPVAEPVATLGLVIVLLIYLLLRREDLRDRILCLIGRGHLTTTTKALDDAGRRISRYLLAQFFLNLAFGVVIGIGLFFIGVPHAALWGFLSGLLRYIPYLGPWIAASLPVTMSLLLSPGWLVPMAVVALFVICELTSNLIVEPWVFGQSIGVSQAALIVAIAFWTWLWGPMGLVLAAPLTVCLVVLGKYVPALKFFDVLLGDEPVLGADTTFYQRLLARDEDEASDIIEEQTKTRPAVEICDQVLIPALVAARQDHQARQLSDDDYEFVCQAVKRIADEEEIGRAELADAEEKPQAEVEAAEALGPPLLVMACGAQNGVEATALALLQHLLDPQHFALEIISPESLVSETLELIAKRRPAIVCIAALPSGGLAHTRHLCKRLKQRLPEQKIIVGRWGGGPEIENRSDWVRHADYIGVTLEETLQQLAELAQFLRPPQPNTSSDDGTRQTTPHSRHRTYVSS